MKKTRKTRFYTIYMNLYDFNEFSVKVRKTRKTAFWGSSAKKKKLKKAEMGLPL
jgi:hypothetical protein